MTLLCKLRDLHSNVTDLNVHARANRFGAVGRQALVLVGQRGLGSERALGSAERPVLELVPGLQPVHKRLELARLPSEQTGRTTTCASWYSFGILLEK